MASGRVQVYLDDGIASIKYATVDAYGERNPASGYLTTSSNISLASLDHLYIASCTLESDYDYPWKASYSGSFSSSSTKPSSGSTSTVNANIYPQDGSTATVRLSATDSRPTEYTYTFVNDSDYSLYLEFELDTSSTTSLTIASGRSKSITCAPSDLYFDPDACEVDGKSAKADCIYWQRTSPTTGTKYCLDTTDGATISLRSSGNATYTFTVSGYTPPPTYYYYTVAFDVNGGTGTPNSVSAGPSTSPTISVQLPSYGPIRSNYEFIGWYCSSTGKTYGLGATYTNTGTTAGKTYTLIAQWQIQTLRTATITFDANGGTGAPSSRSESTYDYTVEITIPSYTPVRDGYKFDSWYCSDTEEYYDAGETYEFPASASGNTYILVAQWTKLTVYSMTVAFDANGGIGKPSNVLGTSYSSTITVTLPNYGPTKTGYQFNGWYCSDTGETYDLSDSYTNVGSASGITYTLVAQWLPIYTVIVNYYSYSGSPYATYTYTSTNSNSITKRLEAGPKDKTGYTFDCWEHNGLEYDGGISFTFTGTVAGTVYDFSAIYTANTYIITLDPQGGTGGSTSVTATYDQLLPDISVPSRSGYKFYGYFTSTDGSGTQYYDSSGGNYGDIIWKKTSGLTLYAYWSGKFAWTYEKAKGIEWNLTADEWNGLIDFVNARRSSAYSFTAAVKDNPFTAAMYNQMVSAIGSGTNVNAGDIITGDLMNELVTNANAMS